MSARVDIDYRLNPPLHNDELDRLYTAAWPNHQPPWDFGPELEHLFAVIGAYAGDELVGCVKLAWDGAVHAFLLEPTVHPRLRRRGIGRTLVQLAEKAARERGLEWLHVDYEPELTDFYRACGFEPTAAGLIRLDRPASDIAQRGERRRAILLIPDLSAQPAIAAFRKRWDPLANDVAPHLTLVFPFEDALTSAALQRHIVQATTGIAPFTIRLKGVSASDSEYIFVNVKVGNDRLIELHDRLYSGPLQRHLSLAHTFVPHMTIGRVADRGGFTTALQEAVGLGVDTAVSARALSIYTIAPNGARHVEAEVPLGA